MNRDTYSELGIVCPVSGGSVDGEWSVQSLGEGEMGETVGEDEGDVIAGYHSA